MYMLIYINRSSSLFCLERNCGVTHAKILLNRILENLYFIYITYEPQAHIILVCIHTKYICIYKYRYLYTNGEELAVHIFNISKYLLSASSYKFISGWIQIRQYIIDFLRYIYIQIYICIYIYIYIYKPA